MLPSVEAASVAKVERVLSVGRDLNTQRQFDSMDNSNSLTLQTRLHGLLRHEFLPVEQASNPTERGQLPFCTRQGISLNILTW